MGTPGRPTDADTIERIIVMRVQRVSLREIERRLEVSRHTIAKYAPQSLVESRRVREERERNRRFRAALRKARRDIERAAKEFLESS